MSLIDEQVMALGGLFTAAALVDRLARTGQTPEQPLICLVNSLLVRDPKSTAEVYGGDDLALREGYRVLAQMLARNPSEVPRETLRYALQLHRLERQLSRRPDLLEIIGQRLDAIAKQVEHFGPAHENVLAAGGALYQDTLSTLRLRIQVHGEMRYLNQAAYAAKIRTLLLAGIRSARLWQQLGGHRWQLLFKRKALLETVQQRLKS